MRHALALLPLLVLASACARTEPVTEEELETVDTAPAPALEELEVADDGPDALPTSAMGWLDADDAVVLGASRDDPTLEIACAEGDSGLVLTRFGVEGDGTAGTLTIVGNGASARVPVVAAEAGQEGEFNWTATLARGELAGRIRTAFLVDEPVNITATGVEPIVVSPAQNLRDLLDRCVGDTDDSEDGGEAAETAVPAQ